MCFRQKIKQIWVYESRDSVIQIPYSHWGRFSIWPTPMACLPFTVLIFHLFSPLPKSLKDIMSLIIVIKGRWKIEGSLISILHIFFPRISRAHKTHSLPISISPCPFSGLTCDFQVIFGNLKPVRDHRCQDRHDCYSFGRICFLKTTKAVKKKKKRKLFFSFSILFQMKKKKCGCMAFNKIFRPSWLRLVLFSVFTRNSI